MLTNVNSNSQAEVREASKQWHHLRSIEEQFYRQKSRIQWLKEGDQNTAYFHKSTKVHASRNTIHQLTDSTGSVLTDLSAIKTEAGKYFSDFLQALPSDFCLPSAAHLASIIDYRCPGTMSSQLVRDISREEIKSILFSMPKNKAPGPDGYTMEFFTAAWSTIGDDFVIGVQSFFMFSFLPKGVNATILALIPKTSDAKTMKDYHPIACCNILYKVVSKILASHLKLLLPNMVELNQSAFIKGRLLLENVLLATELVKDYHKPSISARSALKLDIAKAFDSIRWQFIIAVLHAMELPAIFIRWIEVCISTASFSVAINGELEGFFPSNRGLRQGCALSPYIYVIVNNVLSKLLNSAAARGDFGYHPKCKQDGITHLSFADDIIIFTDGTQNSIQGILRTLEVFSVMSGLRINTGKSELFLSGWSPTQANQTMEGFQLCSLPIRYLGLPLTTRTMTTMDYAPLVDRIRTRLLGWASKHLSYAGRLQLIKAVITSMVNFWLSIFRLPKKCLKEIEGMCSAFLWSGSPNQTGKSKVSWADVCLPKSEGGLGIRRLDDSARVYAYSLIWRLLSSSDSLWTKWATRHLIRHHTFWDTPLTNLGSWIWKKLLKCRDTIKEYFKVEIGDGCKASFWHDSWLPFGPLILTLGVGGPRSLGIPISASVRNATAGGQWKISLRSARSHAEVLNTLRLHPLPSDDRGRDTFLWRHGEATYKSCFSSSRTCDQLRTRGNKESWTALVWFPQNIPRSSFVAWLACRNRLSTGDRMRNWGITQPCMSCGKRDETRDHLFFACP